MYKIKIVEKVQHPKRKKKTFDQVTWAQKDSGEVCEFPKRQKAAQWIRNHRRWGYRYFIIHPDETEELVSVKTYQFPGF